MKLPEKHRIELLKQVLNRIGKNEEEIKQIVKQVKNEINLTELNESLSKDGFVTLQSVHLLYIFDMVNNYG